MRVGDLSQEDAENRDSWKLGVRKFKRKTIQEEEEKKQGEDEEQKKHSKKKRHAYLKKYAK
jgi:hypothetical protein